MMIFLIRENRIFDQGLCRVGVGNENRPRHPAPTAGRVLRPLPQGGQDRR